MLSQKTKDTLLGPLNANNPVVVQILGICSALAVTVQLKPALVMGIAVTIIVAMSNVIVSLIRNTIPMRVRIIVQLVVVAALVTLVSEVLKAFAYDVAMQLSVYLGLIITNCILMGRLEAFAMTNKPWDSFLDGLGNGLGYAIILVIVAFVRELLGSGQLLGFQVIPQWCYDHGYENCGMMLMPAMALILVGCVIWVHLPRRFKEREDLSRSGCSRYFRARRYPAGQLPAADARSGAAASGVPQFHPLHRRHCRYRATGGDGCGEIQPVALCEPRYLPAADCGELRYHGWFALHAAAYRPARSGS